MNEIKITLIYFDAYVRVFANGVDIGSLESAGGGRYVPVLPDGSGAESARRFGEGIDWLVDNVQPGQAPAQRWNAELIEQHRAGRHGDDASGYWTYEGQCPLCIDADRAARRAARSASGY